MIILIFLMNCGVSDMHKYFKELDKSDNITGLCSISYKKNEKLWEYFSKVYKAVEISEKEYDRLRKLINHGN